jgi:hypothetical protein
MESFSADANKIVFDCSYSVAASRTPPEFSGLSEWNNFAGNLQAGSNCRQRTNPGSIVFVLGTAYAMKNLEQGTHRSRQSHLEEHFQSTRRDPTRTLERVLAVLNKNEILLALDRRPSQA